MITQAPELTQVAVPTEALRHLEMSPSELELEVRLMVAARLYERHKASTGKAAELVGVPRTVLLSRLGSFAVSLSDLSSEELLEDMENALRGSR